MWHILALWGSNSSTSCLCTMLHVQDEGQPCTAASSAWHSSLRQLLLAGGLSSLPWTGSNPGGHTQFGPRKDSGWAKSGSLSHRWNGALEQIGGVQQDAVAPQADHEINVHVQPAGSSTTWRLMRGQWMQILKSHVGRKGTGRTGRKQGPAAAGY